MIEAKICKLGYCLANGYIVLLIIPILILLLFIIKKNFVVFRSEDEKKAFKKGNRIMRDFIIASRTLIILFLLIAIATPNKIKEETTPGNPSLKILADNSTSFNIFEKGIADELKSKIEGKIPVELKYIAYGDRSAIGDGILYNAEGDDHLLVISDGNNNYGRDLGDVILFSSMLNTSINILDIKPIEKDAAVRIDGPSEVIMESENAYKVIVNNVGNLKYNLEVSVDGNPVSLDQNNNFNLRFSSGYHKITAKIIVKDYFPDNNIYYKSIKVIPRPKMLYISGYENPLYTALNRIYDVELRGELPDKLADYDVVLLDNVNANSLTESNVDLLTEYVSDKGNGLIVVGGDNAYDKGNYKGSLIESMLPVQVGIGDKARGEDFNVVFLVDLSGTAGLKFSSSSQNTVIDVEKAILNNIIQGLGVKDNVGIAGFTTKAHLISALAPIGTSIELQNKISTLKVPEGSPGTLIFQGLWRARQMLEDAKGSKNVVLISDGQDHAEMPTLDQLKLIRSQGIKLYTIGMGAQTNREFMKKLAKLGGGLYFEPSESQRLRILFGGEPSDKDKEDTMSLVIADTGHWITQAEIELSAKVGGYNYVVPKAGGRKLVTTTMDRPIITAGRYGIGRIVAITTDDGSKWGGELLSKKNSAIITRSVNWAIGDTSRNKKFDVKIKDTNLGDSTQVNVVSNEMPSSKDLEFSKSDVNTYTAAFMPSKTGFFEFLGATVAVNYNKEYGTIGLNPGLNDLVTVSGGHIFNPDKPDDIVEKIKEISKRKKVRIVNYRWPFIIIAIMLFLFEVAVRRIRENRNIGKG